MPDAFADDHADQQTKPDAPAASFDVLSSSMAEHQLDSLMESAAMHALDTPFDDDGNPIPLRLDQFSNLSGIQADELQVHVGAVLDGFQQQADSALQSLGVDLDNFYGFLKDEHPGKLQDAMRQHYLTKDPSVWLSLVPLYRSSVLPSDEALARAGIPVSRMDGQTYITMNGMQMTLQQAAKSGLI